MSLWELETTWQFYNYFIVIKIIFLEENDFENFKMSVGALLHDAEKNKDFWLLMLKLKVSFEN